jgi:hypothetical protein
MSETTKVARQREMTDEDFQALMDADVWLDGFNAAGGTRAYQGMWIAVHGEQVVAADADKQELYRQLGALGDSINRLRVLVRYVHTLGELHHMP